MKSVLTRVRAALRKRSLELGEVAVLVAAFFTAAATDMLQRKWSAISKNSRSFNWMTPPVM
jgi:hypothetical protein